MRAPRLFPEDIELDDRLDAMISADPDGDGAEYAGAFASLLRELASCQRAHREYVMLPDDCPITHRKAVEFKARASRDALQRDLERVRRAAAGRWEKQTGKPYG